MSLFRKTKPHRTVDVMLVHCVPEPGVNVTPASGKELRRLAQRALGKIDRTLALSPDTYIRFGLIQQDPTRGLAPGLGTMMPAPPGVDRTRFLAAMGFKPTSQVVDEIAERQVGEFKALLDQRRLDPDSYELRSFRETPDPGVTFLWIAAVRKVDASVRKVDAS